MAATRNTIQKNIIKTAVTSMHNHPSADMVYDSIKDTYPSISKATVYRVLNGMAELGEILRVRFTDGPDIYDFNCDDHYHVRCAVCGKVDDVMLIEPDDLEKLISDSSGYTVQGHVLIFQGLCPECAAKMPKSEN